jgi:hypothetical protein
MVVCISIQAETELDGVRTMKKPCPTSFALHAGLALTLALGIMPSLTLAQDAPAIVGDWSGTLNPGAQPKKKIVVHIAAAQDGTLSGTIDYPDQDTSGVPMTAITYRKSVLHFESTPSLTIYDGTMSQDKTRITGTVKQGSLTLDLNLTRTP